MGLDASAFRSATLTEPHERTDQCFESDHVLAYIIDDSFHRSLRGLSANRCYEVNGRAVRVSNSYVGHGGLRRLLAWTFLEVQPEDVWRAPDDFANAPFFELIHFADNEGTIGPEAAADLAADFKAGREKFWVATENDVIGWNRSKYDEWTEAFTAAADGGLVRFA